MNIWNVTRLIFGGRAQREFCAAFVLFFVFLGLIGALWSTFRSKIGESDVYQVKLEDFKLWDPAPWLPDDFVSEALEYLPPEAQKKRLNKLDKTLIQDLTVAFASHPLVARVESIAVGYPEIKVRLIYKQPVAKVDTSTRPTRQFLEQAPGLFTGDETFKLLRDPSEGLRFEKTARQEGEYVVDALGRRLPDRYFENCPDVLAGLPTIYGIETTPVETSTKPVVSYGPCSDRRLADAAKFADFLDYSGALRLLGIALIFTFQPIGEDKDVYFLYTKSNATIKWGRFDLPPNDDKSQDYYKKNAEVYEEEARAKLFKFQRQKLDVWKEALTSRPLEELNGLDLSDALTKNQGKQESARPRDKK